MLLADSEIFVATNTGIFYAEARDPINGCVSNTRTAVQLNILTTPTVSLTDPSDLCDDTGIISLSGIPAGGTFNGMGVTGSQFDSNIGAGIYTCLLYTSPSPRDRQKSRMPSSA